MKRGIPSTALLSIIVMTLIGWALFCRAQDATPTTSPSSPTTQPDAAAAAGTKFYGVVSAVDTKAMTFTVDDQVYTVTADTKIGKADKPDEPATLADAIVGQPARGTYSKSADGKLVVSKVRWGRKTGGKSGGKKNKATATTQPQN